MKLQLWLVSDSKILKAARIFATFGPFERHQGTTVYVDCIYLSLCLNQQKKQIAVKWWIHARNSTLTWAQTAKKQIQWTTLVSPGNRRNETFWCRQRSTQTGGFGQSNSQRSLSLLRHLFKVMVCIKSPWNQPETLLFLFFFFFFRMILYDVEMTSSKATTMVRSCLLCFLCTSTQHASE